MPQRADVLAARYPPPGPLCGPTSPSRGEVHRVRCRSYAQPSRKRREVERTEAVVLQPAYVGLEELAQIRDAVFEHRDTVDAHAPGEALVLVGIEAAIAQHIRVHHAAAENLQPV